MPSQIAMTVVEWPVPMPCIPRAELYLKEFSDLLRAVTLNSGTPDVVPVPSQYAKFAEPDWVGIKYADVVAENSTAGAGECDRLPVALAPLLAICAPPSG